MGVTGLWRLIEPSGKPVPLETLENKILAIDVSIWLHQAIKGFQDAQGAPLPNAHLLGIYHRVCKLLYFRIKPIFVFDGGVPNLKKETISKRNQQKQKKLTEADRLQKQLLTTLLKHSAVNKILSEKTKSAVISKSIDKPNEDIYKLPPTELDSTLSSSEDETTTSDSSPTKPWDLHTIDEKSPHFKSLPADVRHEILTDLKETRKQSSWGRLHELPKQSDEFSGFQMKRLLKRNWVQVSLEEAEKEMGGRSLSLAELETLLTEQGVDTSSSLGRRIASDENTRFLLIKDVKKAMDDAKKKQELEDKLKVIKEVEETVIDEGEALSASQFQKDLEQAIQLSLQDVPSTSKQATAPNCSFLDFNEASSDEEEDVVDNRKKLSSAESYMLEYSGLTPNEIAKIINNNSDLPPKKLNCKSKAATSLVGDGIVSEGASGLNNASRDLNHVSHSTSPETNTKIGEGFVNDAGEVQVISDEASSEASDDFLEVSEENTSKEKSAFEILIKPEESLEDDLFSDIFSDKKESVEPDGLVTEVELKVMRKNEGLITNCSEKSDIFKSAVINTKRGESTEENEIIIEIVPKVVMKDEELTIKLNYKDEAEKSKNLVVSESEVINTETNKNVTESKEERKRNVVAEFLKPLEATEKLDNSKLDENEILTTEQLEVIETNLRLEKEELISGKLSKERMAGSLTDQIYQEAQELLTLFGVPFIVAPMEAEAQCAFLDDINLTDGTITDDSDIWLFGGKTVYKNFFNQHKHVKEFRAENVQHHFKLTREQMILLALLVGSDYTVGIQGVGPVTALEILAAFPPSKLTDQLISGLEEFRKWLSGERAAGPGRATLRNKLKNVTLTESFPSLQVVKAYLEPTIDSSKEPFSWAKPDIAGLTSFARQKFGWTRTKSEEILKPVVKRLNESRIQKSIKDYFQTKHKIDSGEAENKMSKRVKKAINRIGRDPNENSDEEKKKVKKPRRHKKEVNDGLSSDEDVQVLQKTRTQSKKKLEAIHNEVQEEIEKRVKKPRTIESLHKKDLIPQKEQDKIDALRSKIKAIEVFRKSKKGPGFLQKRKKVQRNPKEDAELSESSSD